MSNSTPTFLNHTDAIAVVGMACRFPGGSINLDEYWKFLCRGHSAIRPWPQDRWDIDSFYHPDKERPGTCYAPGAAMLEGLEDFDADFFSIMPIEASRMSPNQRLLLETAWESMEQAGCDPLSLRGSDTGVFVGISSDEYGEVQRDHLPSINAFTNAGGTHSIAANRISHAFNFHGPSIAIDTACSSSLVALHAAVGSLREKECRMALVGAVNTIFKPGVSVGFSRAGMLSVAGECQTFDAAADGFARAEGAGMICLKRLADAIADGDAMWGVVAGTGVNQDGRTQGISLPSSEAQQALLERTYARVGIDPNLVSYVEAHGTGTPVGDPIECSAIGAIIGKAPNRSEPCLIGSVKGQTGHLEAAAGMAGLIKVLLCMKHGFIPAGRPVQALNPSIDFEGLGLRPVLSQQPWDHTVQRWAGISSFGFGGTNAHAIVGSWPVKSDVHQADRQADRQGTGDAILPLSARSQASLAAKAEQILTYVDQQDHMSLADLVTTSWDYRSHLPFRMAVAVNSLPELKATLARGISSG